MPCQSNLISNSHGAGTLAAWSADMPGWVIDGSDRNEQDGWVKDGVHRPEKTHALTSKGAKGLKRRQFGPPLPVQPVYYPPLTGSHEKRMVRFRRIPTAVVNVPDSVPPFPSITHPTAAPNLPAWAWRSAVSAALEIFRLICAGLLLIRQDGPAGELLVFSRGHLRGIDRTANCLIQMSMNAAVASRTWSSPSIRWSFWTFSNHERRAAIAAAGRP
jgi:hypothetical protein